MTHARWAGEWSVAGLARTSLAIKAGQESQDE